MAAELQHDRMGIEKTMVLSDYLADGLGQLGLNIISGLIGQLIYFYTDKVGLAAGAVATMLLISKIIDAFTDLIMGKIMDNGKSPKGKCRPWFLRMAFPALVLIPALFMIPAGLDVNGKLAFVLITNVLLSAIVFTAVAIPYGAIMALRTKSQEERSKMGIFRAALGYVSGMVIAIMVIPLTNMFGGDQQAWIKIGIIFGGIACLSFWILYHKSRETSNKNEIVSSEDNSEVEEVSFKEGVKILFRNKYWVYMLMVSLFSQLSFGLSGATGAYYAKWVLGDDNLVALLGGIGLIPTFAGFLLVGPMVKKLGVTKTVYVSMAIAILGTAIRAFAPGSFILTVTAGLLPTFGMIPIMALVGVMTNNCVDYNEWKTGKRLLGMTNSVTGFGGKVGVGLGASLTGWVLALGAYNASLSVQPTSAINAIYAIAVYSPLVLYIIIFIFAKKYESLEKMYPQIIAELADRKNQ